VSPGLGPPTPRQRAGCSVNHFEQAGRAAKVQVLCRHLNGMFTELGLDMTSPRDRYRAGEAVRSFTDKEWLQLCIHVGKTKATVPTRLAVIAEYTKTVVKTGQLVEVVL
jgi:hypothetical protein